MIFLDDLVDISHPGEEVGITRVFCLMYDHFLDGEAAPARGQDRTAIKMLVLIDGYKLLLFNNWYDLLGHGKILKVFGIKE